MKYCSILISNFRTKEAIELCIESILKRTDYKPYKIVVFDSSGNDSQDRKYLEKQRDAGVIELLTSENRTRHYYAMLKLYHYCNTELGLFLDSDIEILENGWLSILIDIILSDSNVLGVASFKHKGVMIPQEWFRAPRYEPKCMLLNMELYRRIQDDADFIQSNTSIEDYKGKQIFDIFPQKFPTVWGDTCWKLTEKILFDNKNDFIMKKIPSDYLNKKMNHYGGIGMHFGDYNNPIIGPRLKKIKARLEKLRKE